MAASNLSGQDLRNCYFKNAKFSQCCLSSIDKSILDGADFSGSEIFGISFRNNSLRGANLFHAKLSSIELISVDFSPLIMQKENIFAPFCLNCKFENVIFDNLSIYGARFIGCIFVNCSFKNSTIGDCFFYCCSFENVSISEAEIISRIDFSASLFCNFNIGYSINDIILKGCAIEKTSNIYIAIEEQLEKQKKIKSTAETLNLPPNLALNYVFGNLSDTECKKMLDKYNELNTWEKLPLNSDNKKEE